MQHVAMPSPPILPDTRLALVALWGLATVQWRRSTGGFISQGRWFQCDDRDVQGTIQTAGLIPGRAGVKPSLKDKRLNPSTLLL
jgi:hypothetical protein